MAGTKGKSYSALPACYNDPKLIHSLDLSWPQMTLNPDPHVKINEGHDMHLNWITEYS